jgi:hypothetical protein
VKIESLPMPLESLGILTALSYAWFALQLRRSGMVALGGFIPDLALCTVSIALRAINLRNVKEATAQVGVSALLLLPALCIVWIR